MRLRRFETWVRLAFAPLLAILVLIATFSSHAQAGEGRRVAFVVGNSAYRSVPALPNPANDAKAVANALHDAGFEVVTALDLDRHAFDAEFQKFVRSLNNAEVSLFYYSGHGIQVGGDNRVIPIDAALAEPADMEVETVSVSTILSYMRAHSRVQAIFLDSCRNNPFPAKAYFVGEALESAPAGGGLAAQNAEAGSLIAYATQPGNVAADGAAEHSPFTEAFLKEGFKPNTDLQSAMMRVTQTVWQKTEKLQRPWTSITLVEPLFLTRPALAVAEVTTKTEQEPEPGALQPEDLAKELAAIMTKAFAASPKVPIGVGAVAMLSEMPILRGAPAIAIELTQTPKAGVLYLEGTAVTAGAELTPANLAKLSFEPSLGSQGQEMALGFAVKPAGAERGIAVAAKIVPYVLACDREAGEPLDLQGVTPGVLPNELKPETAVPACEDAIAHYPEIARHRYQLGRALLARKSVPEALAAFEAAAAMGHVRAFNQLGYLAQRGLGVPQDLARATGYFRKAAEAGDPYGMLSYGRALVLGRGVTADPAEGIVYLNRAVELGHTYAMNELGSMYYYGRAVAKNPARGVRFYQAALARDDIYAMNNLGLAHLDGAGVSQDGAKALGLFTRASDGGHPQAPGNIGRMFFEGVGVRKDLTEAVRWYQTGAERGDTWSASNLGWIFVNGGKGFADAAKAAHFYGLAVALDAYQANPDAVKALAAVPAKAKAKAIKTLIGELGPEAMETAADLNATLVLLERKAWAKRNPRLDLF